MIDIQTTDQEMTVLQLRVFRKPLLMDVIGISGLVLGVLATVGYGFLSNAYNGNDNFFGTWYLEGTLIIGLLIGAGFALIGLLLSHPLQSPKPDQLQDIFDSTAVRMTQSFSDAHETR